MQIFCTYRILQHILSTHLGQWDVDWTCSKSRDILIGVLPSKHTSAPMPLDGRLHAAPGMHSPEMLPVSSAEFGWLKKCLMMQEEILNGQKRHASFISRLSRRAGNKNAVASWKALAWFEPPNPCWVRFKLSVNLSAPMPNIYHLLLTCFHQTIQQWQSGSKISNTSHPKYQKAHYNLVITCMLSFF